MEVETDVDASGPRGDSRAAWLAFAVCAAALAAAATWPLWGLAALPMQDYPQHLMVAHMAETFDDPSFDWKTYYEIDLTPRPYTLWYLAMVPLSRLFGAEAAGRLVFTAYVLTVLGAVFALTRVAARTGPPWPSLLLFPLAFNQTYFLGFVNYFPWVPILLVTLLDLDGLARGSMPRWRIASHLLLLATLFLGHPFCILVYCGLAAPTVLSVERRLRPAALALVPAAMAATAFVVWLTAGSASPARSAAGVSGVVWWPARAVVGFYMMMFTGMRWSAAPDLISASLWLAAATIVALAWITSGPAPMFARTRLVVALGTTAAFFVLPFAVGPYSYFNLRVAPVSAFALVAWASCVPMGLRRGIGVAGIAAALLCLSIRLQAAVATEVAEVFPAVARMEKNSVVLPLVFEAGSAALDPVFFYQFHSHAQDYYHARIGGGTNPTLFLNTLLPARFRPGASVPNVSDGAELMRRIDEGAYDYVLTRAPPLEVERALVEHADELVRSGPWLLLRGRTRPEDGIIALPRPPAAPPR